MVGQRSEEETRQDFEREYRQANILDSSLEKARNESELHCSEWPVKSQNLKRVSTCVLSVMMSRTREKRRKNHWCEAFWVCNGTAMS